jgi:hypothetical protein
MDALYEKYDALGAVALVYITRAPMSPVGALHYNFESWDRCRYCFDGESNNMALFAIGRAAASELLVWREAQELYLHISSPKDDAFRTMFDSMLWLVPFRIVLPALAFLTTIDALAEIYRIVSIRLRTRTVARETDSRNISLLICSLEAPSMLLVGFSFAMGLYGPRCLPMHIVNSAYFQFKGVGLFTNCILAMHLSTESYAFQSGQGRRSMFSNFRRIIRVLFVLLILPDVVTIFVAFRIEYSSLDYSGIVMFYSLATAIGAGCKSKFEHLFLT